MDKMKQYIKKMFKKEIKKKSNGNSNSKRLIKKSKQYPK